MNNSRIDTRKQTKTSKQFFSKLAFGICIVVFSSCPLCNLLADDWPQINGPDRNGIATNETLMSQWPKNGLTEVWSHPVGQGYSGPAVVGHTLIIFHRPGKQYLVEALNAKTGKLIWNKALPSEYLPGGPDPDSGPKSVPLIHNKHIYLLGTGGNLFCLTLDEGTIVWQKNILETYRSPSGYFGSGSTPVVINEKLLVNVGGDDAAVVAFDLKSGAEIWKSFDDRASYSSPIELKVGDKSQAVFITRLNAIFLDPDNGEVLNKMRFGKPGATVNGAMPVHVGEFLFFNAAYNVGGRLVKLDAKNRLIEIPHDSNDQFASQYSTPVVLDGMLYGTAGREDFGNGSFRCVDTSSGKLITKWKREKFPVGHTILVGRIMLTLDSDGGFHVIQANPKKFTQIYQTKLFDSKSRAMPAIADGLFYARSNAVRGKGELVCVRVGGKN